MTVAEMLARMSAPEIAEWRAFELAYGPLGRDYGNEQLAQLVEAIHLLISAQANVKDYKVPHSTRPTEWFDERDEGVD